MKRGKPTRAAKRPAGKAVAAVKDSPIRGHRTLSLMETLAVLAIIVVLAGFLYSTLGRVRPQAQVTTDLSHLHQLGSAWTLYASDFDDHPSFDVALVAAYSKVPPATLVSPNDPTKHGFANVGHGEHDAERAGPYAGKVSYLCWDEFFGADLTKVNGSGLSGWLTMWLPPVQVVGSLNAAAGRYDVSPGKQYLRLLFDASVRRMPTPLVAGAKGAKPGYDAKHLFFEPSDDGLFDEASHSSGEPTGSEAVAATP